MQLILNTTFNLKLIKIKEETKNYMVDQEVGQFIIYHSTINTTSTE